jgi:hypothetical protein
LFAELSIDLRQEGESGTIELKAIQNDSEESGEADDFCGDPEIIKLMADYFYHFDYLPLADDDKALQPTFEHITMTIDFGSDKSFSRSKKEKKESGRKQALGHCQTVEPSTSSSTIAIGTPATPPAPVAPQSRVHVIEHAKVFAMAVKYQVDGLRDLATAKFKQSAEASWDHDYFAHAIFVVYNSTPGEMTQLRDIVSNILHAHFDKLKDKPEVETVVCSIPQLAYTLLKRGSTLTICANGHTGQMTRKWCSNCAYRYDICKSCVSWRYCPYCSAQF